MKLRFIQLHSHPTQFHEPSQSIFSSPDHLATSRSHQAKSPPPECLESPSLWANTQFAAANLNDPRRTKRLVQITADMARRPNSSLPALCSGDHAKLTALYRFVNNNAITPNMILSAPIDVTLARCREHPLILCVQDTTELDFSGRAATGLGEIGNGKGQGLLQHSALALSPEGKLLGLLDINTHLRIKTPKGETERQRQTRRTQTHIWTDAAGRNNERDFGATRIINLCDRGADRAECLFGFHELGQDYIIRAMYDRKAQGEDNDTRLWEHMDAQPVSLEYTLEVPKRRKKKNAGANPGKAKGKRKAKLQVSYAPVEIPPPEKDTRHAHQAPLKIWAVYVREKNPPDKYEPVEWMLLSSQEVSSPEQARQTIGYYKHRWQIEEWHRCLKQGCELESKQLKSAEAIKRLAAILSVQAVRLLQLKQLSHEETQSRKPAGEVMPEEMVAVVAKLAGQSKGKLSVKAFYEQVAKTGGWLRRSGPPGWLTLWRGWREIELMSAGYHLAMEKRGKDV